MKSVQEFKADLEKLDAEGFQEIRQWMNQAVNGSSDITGSPSASSCALLILDALPLHVAVIDFQGFIIAVNERWMDFARKNDATLARVGVGVNYLEVCRQAVKQGDSNAATALAGLENLIEGTIDRFSWEYPCHSPTQERWFMMEAVRATTFHGIVMAHSDVTSKVIQLKQAEKRIAFKVSLLEQVRNAVIATDLNGEIRYWNAFAQNLFQWQREEVMGSKIVSVIIPERFRPKALAFEARVYKEGFSEVEIMSHRKDGHCFPIHVIGTLTRDESGQPTGILGVCVDISERKRTEAALRSSKQAIHRLSAELLRMQDEERRRTARALHDSTAQKLTRLILSLGVLEETLESLEEPRKMVAECLGIAENCAEEIRALSNVLHPPLLDELGLEAALDNYVAGVIQRSGLKIELEVDPEIAGLPKHMELALFRVVQESLENVLRHSGAMSARVQLVRTRDRIVLEVSDSGRGIPKKVLRRVREGSLSPGYGMMGMRERMGQLSGTLEVDSSSSGTVIRAILTKPAT